MGGLEGMILSEERVCKTGFAAAQGITGATVLPLEVPSGQSLCKHPPLVGAS